MNSRFPTTAADYSKYAVRAIAGLAILIGAASWSQPHVDGSDLWWHLASGRSIAAQHEVPRVDAFSHTAAGDAWTNHSWLWGSIFWAAYDLHADLTAWLNLALIVALFALVVRIALRTSRSWLAAGAATWLAAATCHWFLDIRPHITTLLFTAVLLSTLESRRAPWLWPPLVAVWANLHAGFAFGLGLIALHTLMQSVQAIRERASLPRAVWIGLVCATLAAGLNPWGFSIYAVPFQHIYHDSPFANLVEWQSTALSVDPRSYAGRFWWMALIAVLGVSTRKATRFSIALAVVTAAMAISARRFIPVFAICAAPLVALGLSASFDRARRWIPALAAPRASAIASGAGLAVAILLWSDVHFLPRPLQRWTSEESYPSGAAAYLAAMEDPPQRLFNYYNWGGYLILRVPGVPVSIDSRASTLYSDAFAAEHFAMMDAAADWRDAFDAYGFDAVLVPTGARLQAALRNQRPAWRVGYIDPRSILLFPPANRSTTDLPTPAQLLPDTADLKLSRGFRLRRRGNLDAARSVLVEAQRMDPLQLFTYGELMFVASLQRDAEGVKRWLDEALRVYPRRWNPIWSFAEQAWSAMDHCEAAREALRKIRLGGPFVADELRTEIQAKLRLSDCSRVGYAGIHRGSAP